MKHLLPSLMVAMLLGQGLAATAQPTTTPRPVAVRIADRAPLGEQPQQFTLSNGMTLIVKPDRRAPTAVQMVWVRVGSMDEVSGTSGVAHVVEHMIFKGTPTLPPGEFSRRIAEIGGRDNAFTTRDYTGYHQQIPAAKLEEAMKLQADTFAHNRWSDDEFKREIEVIKEERRMRIEDSPRAKLFEVLDPVSFVASPYGRPVIGWMSDLDAMAAQEVRDFYRKWYTPKNAALVIAGDVDPQRVRQLAERYYGRIAAHPVPVRKPQVEPVQAGIRRVEVKAPADQAYVALQFKVPQLTSFESTPANDDAIALSVLAAVLDGYSGARLDRALTQGPGRVADSAGAGNGLWGRGPQLFVLDGVPSAGKTPQQVEAGLRAEVARIAREGVTEDELQRVKTQWVAGEVYKLDSVFNQARELGSLWVNNLPLDASEQLIRRLRAVTAAQVQSVAARYFGDDQVSVGTLHPLPRDPNRRPRPPQDGAADLR